MAGNQSLQRGLLILQLLDQERTPLGVREIARRLDLSPPIVQRLINTLFEQDFVVQDADSSKYRLSYRVFTLGSFLLKEDELIVSALRELRRLADRHQLNGFLGANSDERLIYLLAVQSSGPIAIRTVPGASADYHSTAMGKVMLSGLSDTQLRARLDGTSLPPLTPHTITDPDLLMDEIVAAREAGFAVSKEENLLGILAVAAPIRDKSGQIVAAMSAAFAPTMLPQQTLSAVAAMVMEAAAEVSSGLGYQDSHGSRQAVGKSVHGDAA